MTEEGMMDEKKLAAAGSGMAFGVLLTLITYVALTSMSAPWEIAALAVAGIAGALLVPWYAGGVYLGLLIIAVGVG